MYQLSAITRFNGDADPCLWSDDPESDWELETRKLEGNVEQQIKEV